jgi:hypothetical protein
MKEFSSGAYCFPVLLTIPVLLLLSVYLVATCAGVHQLLSHEYRSMAIPLAVGGLAMVPAAMGRCDLGRLQSAAPGFLLGLGVIEAMPAFRIWWRPLALYTVLLPLGILGPAQLMRHEVQRIRHASGLSPAHSPHQPCSEIYRTPNITPALRETAPQDCLDTGYFIGPINAFTPGAIQRKIADLDRRPRQPILLFDLPLSKQMPVLDDGSTPINWEGQALYYPKIRHSPLTYAAIFDYIASNYVPDPNFIRQPDGWNYRVWRPKAGE